MATATAIVMEPAPVIPASQQRLLQVKDLWSAWKKNRVVCPKHGVGNLLKAYLAIGLAVWD